jgi:phosphoserine phosphatase
MTAALVEIDPVTRIFRYVSAGHNPLLWIHRGEPRWLESCGMPMGIMAGAAYPPPAPLVGAPGDLLILYTDGFTEAADPANDLYGDDRLAAAALASDGEPGQVLKAMIADVDRFAAGRPLADDLTMVVIRFT